MKFSEKVCYYRKKAGLSQEALAERLGVSRQAVSKWETGESEPELAKLRKLSQALAVSADTLLSEAEPSDTPQAGPDAPGAPRPPRRDWHAALQRQGWLLGVAAALLGLWLMVPSVSALLLFHQISHPEPLPGFDPVVGPVPQLPAAALFPVWARLILGAILFVGGLVFAVRQYRRRSA